MCVSVCVRCVSMRVRAHASTDMQREQDYGWEWGLGIGGGSSLNKYVASVFVLHNIMSIYK